MHRVEPNVYLVGESMIRNEELSKYIEETYGEEGIKWHVDNVGPVQDSQLITEIMGRLCYRSFAVGEHNKNITKIRQGNDVYIENILNSKHGSVLEHGSTSWIIKDVSRVFTHELVRHRAGVAVSQESLRYVRMDDFGLWIPEDPELTPEIVKLCEEKFKQDEVFCRMLSSKFGLDEPKKSFAYKKKWTSFIRRFAPQGMATTIGITINFRAIRHVIEMRTAASAEVEIKHVFDKIAQIAKKEWPNLMQDFDRDFDGTWVCKNSKV